jgi:hypothetical protein
VARKSGPEVRLASPKNNPFRTSRIEALPFRDPSSPQDARFVEGLLERWNSLDRRGVLVGPKGHGKTTLLEELEFQLEARGFELRRARLRIESPTPDPATRRHLGDGLHDGVVISIDGLDLLRPLTWWRLRRGWRAAGGILATSHRPGRLPTLYEHRSTPELLRQLVRELLDDTDHRLVEPSLVESSLVEPSLVEPRLEELFARHQGNVRECFRELYDEFAG